MSYCYRLYRAAEFCALEVGFDTREAATDAARDAMAVEPVAGPYTRAEITHNLEVIEVIPNDNPH